MAKSQLSDMIAMAQFQTKFETKTQIWSMVVTLNVTLTSLHCIATNQEINIPSPNMDDDVINLESAPNAKGWDQCYAGLDLCVALIRMVTDERKIKEFILWKGAIQTN